MTTGGRAGWSESCSNFTIFGYLHCARRRQVRLPLSCLTEALEPLCDCLHQVVATRGKRRSISKHISRKYLWFHLKTLRSGKIREFKILVLLVRSKREKLTSKW